MGSLSLNFKIENMEALAKARNCCYCEITAVVMKISVTVPLNFQQVPFLTVGNDVGKREVVFESGSAFDGYVVEDVKMDDGFCHRRLVFKKSPNLVQSEFRILNGLKSLFICLKSLNSHV